jgi:hypothetical protein
MNRRRCAVIAALAVAGALAAPSSSRAASPFGSLLRSRDSEAPVIATREFATEDLPRAQRLAIAALQDLGLALESVDAEHGTFVASRLDAHAVRLTVTLAANGEAKLLASVATDYAGAPVSDPRPAEAFFTAFAAQLEPEPVF